MEKRGKGLDISKLTPEDFEKMHEGEVVSNKRPFVMAKHNFPKTEKERVYGLSMVIEHVKDYERKANKTKYNGRNFDGNDSVPWV